MRAGRVVWLGGGQLQSLCDGGDHWENDRTTLLPDALPKRKLVRVAVGWRRGSPPGDWRGRRLDRQGEVTSGQAVFGRGVGVPEAFRYAGCGIRLGRMPNKRFLVSCVISDCVVVSRECKALWLIARGKPVQDRWSARHPSAHARPKGLRQRGGALVAFQMKAAVEWRVERLSPAEVTAALGTGELAGITLQPEC